MTSTTDSEVLFEDSDSSNEGDFVSMIMDNIGKIPWKIAIILFILYIIINSDIFVNKVLSNITGTAVDGTITSKGIIVSGMILSIMYVLTDFLQKMDYI
jgi:hypothetical protein